MTVVVPRLDRGSVDQLLAQRVGPDIGSISAALPDLDAIVTYAPVSGERIDDVTLRALRTALLELAGEHGMPGGIVRSSEFDGRAARIIHKLLPMTPHEASHEEVWSFLTCCWLLDVAVWRFGHEADPRRFIGNVNRNTFRRLWWRAEVLGPDVDLTRLGEDELVNIMERPTIAADRRLARAVALTFLGRLEEGVAHERMMLMREAMKRLLRLTPFVAFPVLAVDELELLVSDVFDAAASGLAGTGYEPLRRAPKAPPLVSPDVVVVRRVSMGAVGEVEVDPETTPTEPESEDDFEMVAQAAVDIARRAGRVTNSALREVVTISPEEAREVFQWLMLRGLLVRRGIKRGTHYVLPDSAPSAGVRTAEGVRPQPPASDTRDSALRRFLRGR